MNSKQKGDKREREAKELLTNAGWTIESPNSTPYPQAYGVDFFGLFDFMGFKDQTLLLGQVKSNSPRGITSFSDECTQMNIPLDEEWIRVEFWTCYDREGWRIDSIQTDGYTTLVDERNSNDTMGSEVKKYLTEPS